MDSAYAVILAGGRGERFWPLSTARKPKQLLSLVLDKPMLAQAVERLDGLIDPNRVYIITNQEHAAATREVVPSVPAENVIGEPVGRDTAAAVALACALVRHRDSEGVFCILTADHVIGPRAKFQDHLRASLERALSEDALFTIGIQPTEPSTGYGYIEAGESLFENDDVRFLRAKRFVEKPDRDTAQKYLDSGNYYWNSGMFIWSVRSLEKAFSTHRPQLSEMINRLVPIIGTPEFDEALACEYEGLEKISIDYALMEKSDNIVMSISTFDWDDVGAWPALDNHFDKDADGNVVMGTCLGIDAPGNIVFSRDRVTALIGVENLVVVHADGATLICHKDRAQDVKEMVKRLKQQGSFEDVL